MYAGNAPALICSYILVFPMETRAFTAGRVSKLSPLLQTSGCFVRPPLGASQLEEVSDHRMRGELGGLLRALAHELLERARYVSDGAELIIVRTLCTLVVNVDHAVDL